MNLGQVYTLKYYVVLTYYANQREYFMNWIYYLYLKDHTSIIQFIVPT